MAQSGKTISAAVHAFPDSEEPARRLAALVNARFETIDAHIFPDGERRVRVTAPGRRPREERAGERRVPQAA